MKFRTQHAIEPEINLIAFINVLLVILIFLMLSSTYNKYIFILKFNTIFIISTMYYFSIIITQ